MKTKDFSHYVKELNHTGYTKTIYDVIEHLEKEKKLIWKGGNDISNTNRNYQYEIEHGKIKIWARNAQKYFTIATIID